MPTSASSEPRLTVVVPTHDTRSLTLACVESLLASQTPQARQIEVLLLDDASQDGTAEAVRSRFATVRVLRNEHPQGFTRSANRGLTAAKGEILLLLNSDTEIEPGAWGTLEETFRQNRRLGIVGAALRYPDGKPQWSGGANPSLLWLFALASGLPALVARIPGARALRPVRGASGAPVEWVTGAAMAFRREVWDEVGPFDESFRFYCQDLDFCARARASGWEVAVAPGFRVIHHHGATIGRRAGAAGHQNPELLWSDLVRWGWKHRGPSWARRAALVLGVGGRLRLASRALRGLFHSGPARQAWQRGTLVYRHALASVRDEARTARGRSSASEVPAPASGPGDPEHP